jgi:predicted dehydrogenase
MRQAKQQFKLVAIADQKSERREAAGEFGAKAFADYRELLEDRSLGIDLVVNALPSHLHPEGTMAALRAGYHVMTEKPAAVRVADFDAMVAASKQVGRRLFIFQNSRFNPAFMKVREVLESGRLGKLVHARISFSNFARRWDWQASQEFWGGNINNTGPHPLDQAIMLFGDRTPNVFANLQCENAFGDADAFSSVSLYGKDAPLIEVVTSSFQAYPQGGTYNLSCTRGGLQGDLTQLKWKYFDPAKAPPHTALPTMWSDNRTYNKENLEWIEESWSAPPDDMFQVISKGIYDDVYEALTKDIEPTVRLDEVRRQVAVLEEAHRQCQLPRRKS